MIRIFLYIVIVILAAWLITMLAELSGYAVIELQGQRLDIATNLLIGLAILGLIGFFFGGTFISWMWGLPKRFRRRARDRRQAKGMTALARGLEAVAAGDAVDAQKHARAASKNLEDPALTRLLTAQAAQLAGDAVTAQESYAAMLEAPETEFLGLRGLYMQALKDGDREAARLHAERAFNLRPGALWAFESVLELNLERGAWGDALEAIRLARQNGNAEGPVYERMEGALLTAQAYGARDGGDEDQALKDAERALKKAPTLTPAAALAARGEAETGHRSRSAKILNAAWEARPHPGLAEVMRSVFAEERAEKRRGRLEKLAEKQPEAFESRVLRTRIALESDRLDDAQELIEPLLIGRPPRRILLLAADIATARGREEVASTWRRKAELTPPDFVPGLDGTFNYTTEGWRRLIREYSEHDRLAPPPLEEETAELDSEEVRMLLAPPVPVAAEPSLELIETDPSGEETSSSTAEAESAWADEGEEHPSSEGGEPADATVIDEKPGSSTEGPTVKTA